jgi:hypothetical protein
MKMKMKANHAFAIRIKEKEKLSGYSEKRDTIDRKHSTRDFMLWKRKTPSWILMAHITCS